MDRRGPPSHLDSQIPGPPVTPREPLAAQGSCRDAPSRQQPRRGVRAGGGQRLRKRKLRTSPLPRQEGPAVRLSAEDVEPEPKPGVVRRPRACAPTGEVPGTTGRRCPGLRTCSPPPTPAQRLALRCVQRHPAASPGNAPAGQKLESLPRSSHAVCAPLGRSRGPWGLVLAVRRGSAGTYREPDTWDGGAGTAPHGHQSVSGRTAAAEGPSRGPLDAARWPARGHRDSLSWAAGYSPPLQDVSRVRSQVRAADQ